MEFLAHKWEKELDYRLIKELWAFGGARIAVRFQYEWRSAAGDWFRAYGNENWEFDENGLMDWRQASINDVSIDVRAVSYSPAPSDPLSPQGVRPGVSPGQPPQGWYHRFLPRDHAAIHDSKLCPVEAMLSAMYHPGP